MQNDELKWVIVGCLSVFGLGFWYRSCKSEQNLYKQKLEEFQKVYVQSKLDKNKTLKQIMANTDPKSHKIVCLQNLKPNYQQDTFKLYQRQISVFANYPLYSPQKILEHQMGTEFEAIRNFKEKLLCKLDDFHLSALILNETRKDVNLFKNINKLEALVQTSVSTLYPFYNVAVYGKLYFDGKNASWTLQPFFLTGAFELDKVVTRFYDNKISIKSLEKFAIVLGALVLSYFTIYSPLKRWYRKKNQLKEGEVGALSDMDFFKNKSHITVKAQSLLNCEKCKTKNVEIVYECGHLAICVDCHQKNTSKQCPLCHKASNKFMKIFMA